MKNECVVCGAKLGDNVPYIGIPAPAGEELMCMNCYAQLMLPDDIESIL